MLRVLVTCQRQKRGGWGRAIAQTRRSPGSATSLSNATPTLLRDGPSANGTILSQAFFPHYSLGTKRDDLLPAPTEQVSQCSVILGVTNFPCGSFLARLGEPVSIPHGNRRGGRTPVLGSHCRFHLSFLAVWRIHTSGEGSALVIGV